MLKTKLPLIIIVSNLILLLFIVYLFYENYISLGKFEWVDTAAIEEDEETYLLPILFGIACLSLASLIYESLNWRITVIKNTFLLILNKFLKPLSLLYGTVLLMSSFIIISLLFINWNAHEFEKGFTLMATFTVFILIGIGCLGGFIIYKTTLKKND